LEREDTSPLGSKVDLNPFHHAFKGYVIGTYNLWNIAFRDDRTHAVINPRSHPSVGSEGKENESEITPAHAYPRTIPPFVLRYEIPRGVIFVGQSILRYMLMLVVM
jgi:hypothetical protein